VSEPSAVTSVYTGQWYGTYIQATPHITTRISFNHQEHKCARSRIIEVNSGVLDISRNIFVYGAEYREYRD
jgi:hypothetical protein